MKAIVVIFAVLCGAAEWTDLGGVDMEDDEKEDNDGE